jgi:hypothetical protein
MTIHQYLMQAGKDDARRAGERDRVLLEARRAGVTRRPGAILAALATRGAWLLSRWTGRAQDRLEKPALTAGEFSASRVRNRSPFGLLSRQPPAAGRS